MKTGILTSLLFVLFSQATFASEIKPENNLDPELSYEIISEDPLESDLALEVASENMMDSDIASENMVDSDMITMLTDERGIDFDKEIKKHEKVFFEVKASIKEKKEVAKDKTLNNSSNFSTVTNNEKDGLAIQLRPKL